MTSPTKPTNHQGAFALWKMVGGGLVVVGALLLGLAAIVVNNTMPQLTQSLLLASQDYSDSTIKSVFVKGKEVPLMILLAQHGDWIHAQIYRGTSNNHAVALSDDDKDDFIGTLVCPSLRQALAEQGLLAHYNNNDDDEDESWNTFCNNPTTTSLVDLRPFAKLLHKQEQQVHYAPLASWTHPMQRPTESGLMPPPALPASFDNLEWKYLVVGDMARGVWEYNAKTTVPRHLQRFVKQLAIGTGNVNADDNNTIQLQGQLSQSGGMHRKFHQTLRVNLPQIKELSSATTAVLDILVLIPPDLFLNIEEAIQVPPSSPIVRHAILNVPPDRVIDQEEPTFASPAHGVLLRIEFPVTLSSSSTTLEWDILLHVRYPTPLEKADFLLIAVIPAIPWSLTVVVNDDDDDNSKDEIVLASLACPWTAPVAPPQCTWVAAGRQEYLVPVMVSTTLMALAGSVAMLRTLAKTAPSLQ